MKLGLAMIINFVSNILLFYVILFVVNIPAPFLGLNFDESATDTVSFAPPGFVIPIVWWILFTLLGIARFLIFRHSNSPKTDSTLFLGLGFLCASYAYYTLGLEKLTGISSLWFGLFGNMVVIAAASYLVRRFWRTVSAASLLVAPVVLWTLFATFIVIGELKNSFKL